MTPYTKTEVGRSCDILCLLTLIIVRLFSLLYFLSWKCIPGILIPNGYNICITMQFYKIQSSNNQNVTGALYIQQEWLFKNESQWDLKGDFAWKQRGTIQIESSQLEVGVDHQFLGSHDTGHSRDRRGSTATLGTSFIVLLLGMCMGWEKGSPEGSASDGS